MQDGHTAVTLKALTDIITEIGEQNHLSLSSSQPIGQQVNDIYHRFKLGNPEYERPITRKQAAVVIDQLLHPFETIDVNLYGKFSASTPKNIYTQKFH
jgi:hypothetical protein